jgi:hypothetical protein
MISITIFLSIFYQASGALPGAKPLSSLGQAFLKKFDKTGLKISRFIMLLFFSHFRWARTYVYPGHLFPTRLPSFSKAGRRRQIPKLNII